MICEDVSVDLKTGDVTMIGPPSGPATGHRSGCDCLAGLIRSRRKVRIQPLNHGTSTPPGSQKPLQKTGGGATKWDNPAGAFKQPNGQPGVGTGHVPGSDATVYIDLSDRDGQGYAHGYPMWFVLAHELTTGHATHVITGTAERVRSREEYATIVCEHGHVVEDRTLTRRDPNNASGPRLAPEATVPDYRAPAKEPDDDGDEW